MLKIYLNISHLVEIYFPYKIETFYVFVVPSSFCIYMLLILRETYGMYSLPANPANYVRNQ